MKSLTAILGAFLVLSSASLSAAECAWVLWKKEVRRAFSSPDSTEVGRTRPATWERIDWDCSTLFACERGRQSWWVSYSLQGDVSVDKHVLVRTIEAEDLKVQIEITFHCLPGSVDPREK